MSQQITNRQHSAEQLKALKVDANAELLSRDLAAFVREAWKILEPVTEISWNWHLDLICEYLTLVKQGTFKEKFGADCEGLIFNVPPRTMKSLLITVFFPCWVWASDPARRWMFASYAEKLSTQHSVFRRNVIDSPWYQERWGHAFKFAKDQNLKTHYENSSRGVMFATAMGAAATGIGGDVLVFDDPLNPEQALSEAEREGINTKFDTTFRSRLNDPAKGVKIIVMQRLHELDLTGHVLSKESARWQHVKLPAIAEKAERWEFPITGQVKERAPEELLWPDRLRGSELSSMRVSMGSWAFAGQYQQNPAPLEGGIIKRNWLRFYRALPERFDLMVISADCTFKGTSKSAHSDIDFVAIQVWGKAAGKYYMLPYRLHERLDFGPSRDAVKSCRAKFPMAHAILVEDKANGPAIISELQRELSGIIAINPEGGKIARAQGISPLFEAGSIELPDPQVFDCPWVEQYIHNICTFPKAAHDDDMDATSQALIYIRHKMGSGIMDFVLRGAAQLQDAANVSRGLPSKTGKRIPETRLTLTIKQWGENPVTSLQCNPKQYPEIRQALLDLATEAAQRQMVVLDGQFGWGTVQ